MQNEELPPGFARGGLISRDGAARIRAALITEANVCAYMNTTAAAIKAQGLREYADVLADAEHFFAYSMTKGDREESARWVTAIRARAEQIDPSPR